MKESNVRSEERQREIDELVARCDDALRRSREVRRQTSRVVEEAAADIRCAVAQLRRLHY
jgi:hypothetical protein